MDPDRRCIYYLYFLEVVQNTSEGTTNVRWMFLVNGPFQRPLHILSSDISSVPKLRPLPKLELRHGGGNLFPACR